MRDWISRHLFSPLQGMTYPLWRSLLATPHHEIDPPYWPRAAFQTAVARANQASAALEDRKFAARIDAVAVPPPLFILGHWRHGTTHLHNLLALDPRFAFPTLYQTLYPRSFLTTESYVPRFGSVLLLRTRPHDNVALSFDVPNEDELALCVESGLSPYLGWAFPRTTAHYDRFLSLAEATGDERDRWRASLLYFLKKLTWKHQRPLVLKSPPHTARIKLLLELFPDARFVHIRRHPYAVYRSTRHMYAATMHYWRLQRPPEPGFDRPILALYRTMYNAFLAEWPAIPPAHRCEVVYEDLVENPVTQVEKVYQSLALPDFELVRPRLETYLGSIQGYQKNVLPELPEEDRHRIAHAWQPCFEAWGYAS